MIKMFICYSLIFYVAQYYIVLKNKDNPTNEKGLDF